MLELSVVQEETIRAPNAVVQSLKKTHQKSYLIEFYVIENVFVWARSIPNKASWAIDSHAS